MPRPIIRAKGRLSPKIEIKKGDHIAEAWGLLNRINPLKSPKRGTNIDPAMKNKKREIAWNSNTGLPDKAPEYNPFEGGQSPLEASAHWKNAIDQTYKDFYAKRRVSSIEMNYVSKQHIASLKT